MLVCFIIFEMFCQIMDACTDNYECLVIHNGAKSNRLEDQVFWYKANDHEDFKICCPKHGSLVKQIIMKMIQMMTEIFLNYLRRKIK